MTEKLTPKEINKALECCKPDNDEGCLSCPLSDVPVEDCIDILHTATLDLINRQQEEREAMLEDLQFRTNQVIEQQEDIERLQTENNQFADIGKMYSEIRAEVIKEYMKILEGKLALNTDISNFEYQSIIFDMEQGYKEMVGEQE